MRDVAVGGARDVACLLMICCMFATVGRRFVHVTAETSSCEIGRRSMAYGPSASRVLCFMDALFISSSLTIADYLFTPADNKNRIYAFQGVFAQRHQA